jgi:hypothetical protein
MRSRPSGGVALTWTALYQPRMVCSEDVFWPCLGVLGVPLITVPDSSPRASKGVRALAWRFCRIFARGPSPSRLYFVPGGARERTRRV